jgi:DNA mismatch endonuclease, patch repair protein
MEKSPTDNLTPQQRKHAMKQVKGRNTAPELKVQQILKEMGYDNFQLHPENMVGKPDIIWADHHLALFIHGCFWHGHSCPRGARIPKTHRDYWQAKIERNFNRDQSNQALLTQTGWRILVIWECELKNTDVIKEKIRKFLGTSINQVK